MKVVENTKLSETERAVDALLSEKGIVFYAQYLGENSDPEWQADAWRITFKKTGESEGFEFKTGIGHRKQNARKETYLVRPCAASVLYCLLSDAEALNESFDSWCDCFGYSPDSIKAFDIYRDCCEIGKKIAKVIDHKTQETLRDLLQDY